MPLRLRLRAASSLRRYAAMGVAKPTFRASELTVFTPHMLRADWSAAHGWSAPSLEPVAPLAIHPAAATLHYGVHAFEGMKVYAGPAGPLLFRPELNMARLLRSASRLLLPTFDAGELLACLRALVRTDAAWVPSTPGCALYMRPTIFATGPSLGVAPASEATLVVLLSPTGPYLPPSAPPPSLYLDERLLRAGHGGVGQYKVGGNYAPTLGPAAAAASAHGCMQVLYTAPPPGGRADGAPSSSAASAAGERVLAEAGAMNVFVLFERDAADGGKALHLATPPLDGTILPGVTRDSLLALARAGGGGGGGAALASVAERHVTVAELEAAAAAGQLREIFCCGTAVGVLSVGALVREGAGAGGAAAAAAAGAAAGAQRQPLRPSAAHAPGDDESATLAGRLRARLRDIQTGVVAFNGWAVPVGDGESSG